MQRGSLQGHGGLPFQPGAQPITPWRKTDFEDEKNGKNKKKVDVQAAIRWMKARTRTEKIALGSGVTLLVLLALYVVIEDHDTLFVLSEAIHAIGISVLVHKLARQKNGGGLSLKSQELTALFLTVRLFCSFLMEYDVHTFLDLITLVATAGVIYCLRGPLRSTYQKELDTLPHYLIIAPCAAFACISHPSTRHSVILRILWAFCVYLEAVSVLPQLRMMQKSKIVEKFTAHYVFALGLSRFVSCSHWVLQILGGDRFLLKALGNGPWPFFVLLSEIVQTFILADFCVLYTRSFMEGSDVIQLPAGVV